MSQISGKFIKTNTVANSNLAQMPTLTIHGNNTGGTANVLNLTVAQVNAMLGDVLANGTVPFSANQSLGGFNITNSADPTTAQMLATKNYVDMAVAALNPADACYAATTTNITGTYLNGVAGVGATFTVTATGVFTVDGVTPPTNARILYKDQSSGFQNGIYTLTTPGSLGVAAVFTRASDYNTAVEMNTAGLIPIINGLVNALSSWQQVATITTVGTDALVFTEFTANPSLYMLKANNLSDVASANAAFNNISPLTTKGDLISFSTVNARLAVGTNAQVLTADSTQTLGVKWATPTTGTVTSVAASVPAFLSISGSPITSSGTLAITLSGTALPVANGGTGVTSVTTAPTATAFAGWDANSNLSANSHIDGYTTTATAAGTTTLTVSSARTQFFTGSTTQNCKLPVTSTMVLGQQFLIENRSTGVVTVQSSGANTIKAMEANSQVLVTVILTTGTTAASWDFSYAIAQGALPIADGGTGQVSASAAFGALSPITTTGDIIYSSSGTTNSRLGIGSTGQVLTVAGGIPSWAAAATPAGPRTQVFVSGGNGNGSTNNKMRRFTTANLNTGTDITYTDSATLGGRFVINTAGVYTIDYVDSDTSNGGGFYGIGLNVTNTTTSIESETYSDGKRAMVRVVSTNNTPLSTTWTGILAVNDVIQAWTDGTFAGTSAASVLFSITKVSN